MIPFLLEHLTEHYSVHVSSAESLIQPGGGTVSSQTSSAVNISNDRSSLLYQLLCYI